MFVVSIAQIIVTTLLLLISHFKHFSVLKIDDLFYLSSPFCIQVHRMFIPYFLNHQYYVVWDYHQFLLAVLFFFSACQDFPIPFCLVNLRNHFTDFPISEASIHYSTHFQFQEQSYVPGWPEIPPLLLSDYFRNDYITPSETGSSQRRNLCINNVDIKQLRYLL